MTEETPVTEAPTVTQADVNAAAVYWVGCKARETSLDDIRYFEANWSSLPGMRDCVQAFARHRIAHTTPSDPVRQGGEEHNCARCAEEWSAYMDEAVSKAPEPLRALGEYLTSLLDDDQWKSAERYLNAAVLAHPPASPTADLAITIRTAMLELGTHGACPACINAHSILKRVLDKVQQP